MSAADPTNPLSSLSAAELESIWAAWQHPTEAHAALEEAFRRLKEAESRQAIEGKTGSAHLAVLTTLAAIADEPFPAGKLVMADRLVRFRDALPAMLDLVESYQEQIADLKRMCDEKQDALVRANGAAAQQDAVATARREERDQCKQILTELRTVIGTYQANLAIEVINRAASQVAEAGSPAEGTQG